MSTRGCVAVKKKDGWRGVYNHYDSYPTGLGPELWAELQEANLPEFAQRLLDSTDWRDYLSSGECKYCGREGVGQPHSISGKVMGFDKDLGGGPDPDIKRNLQLTGYPDPEAEYHSHALDGGKSVEDTYVTSEDPDPLFLEWVYVLDPSSRSLEILTHRGTSSNGRPVDEPWLRDDGYWEYGHCAYRHVRIALVDLDGPEPDWQLIQNLDGVVAVSGDSSEAEEVSERLKHGPDAKKCLVCGSPVPNARDYPELEDRPFGHKSCIREKLEDLGAEAEACLTEPQDAR